jgi:translation initiation factor IF-2
LRLPTEYNDYDHGRTSRQRREMEDRVTALMAGTMNEYTLPKRSGGGTWFFLGVLALAGAGGAYFYLKPHEASAPVANNPSVQPSAAQPAAWPPPSTVGPEKQPAAAAVQTPTQRAEAPVAPPPAAVEAVAAPEPEDAVDAAASVEPAHEVAKRPAQPAAQKQPAQVRAHPGWRPSGEDLVYQPPVVYQPPEQAAPPEPEKPKTIEVPGTPPNPFADENAPAPGEDNKYRAGRPQEDEF